MYYGSLQLIMDHYGQIGRERECARAAPLALGRVGFPATALHVTLTLAKDLMTARAGLFALNRTLNLLEMQRKPCPLMQIKRHG